MWTSVALLVFASCCPGLGQQIAKQKCEEYAVLATAEKDSLRCKALKDAKTGVRVEPNEFPATAMLGYVRANSTDIKYLCDATLISEDTLMTAGHCLQQRTYGNPKWVRVGATYTTLGQELEVKESHQHPQYNPGNDIGLVKLKDKLNSSFIPACLDTEGIAVGAGGVGVGRPIGNAYVELREKCPIKSRLDVQPVSECEYAFTKQNVNMTGRLCTKDPTNGPGDCMSGPLYVQREGCAHVVAGVASFGSVCRDETGEGRTPSVYTEVRHHLNWIESITWPSTA